MLFGSQKSEYRRLERTIGYTFRRKNLLATALIHRSYRYESAGVETDNQRMEFLGDAALGFVAGAYMYQRYTDRAEGFLTALRSRLTSGKALAAIAQSIELGESIKVGRGEERSGGRGRHSNLADALESVLGAAYLDGGLKAVEKIFKKIFVPVLDEMDDDVWSGNPKGRLQELAQRRHRSAPDYRLVEEKGPSHARLYVVEVEVGGQVVGRGVGRNKRVAEAQAAEKALARLDAEQDTDGSFGET